ncbi:outer membrane transport energization protein ExbB [Jezberella montanilacus]|jgi:biopolymer transport protein ExbB|uniref:Outer membrane transport energization protein ExbB n=1 Tax=Jezberella montanilacus TaxID=323426 RepID=A0A2T0XF45_9BURK|nr:MotA/TolQ/ExbB proton channel family protein [Jezberella montanilacus]PRY97547.1 outer membrane transport energization protein ExbB [Jezberella montanilacus]|eukprot:gene3882-3931_t
MNLIALLEVANSSGGIVYLLGLLLLVALFVIFERLQYLANMRKVGDAVISMCQHSKVLNPAELKAFQVANADSPVVKLLEVAIDGERAHLSREDLDGNLEEAIMHQVPKLDKSVWLLDTIITLAPLLGLFGTIIGMFNAMSVLGDMQNAAMQISGGIAEALVSTAMGLIVAMIGLYFFNNINNKVRSLVHQMETMKMMILNRHHLFKAITQ